MNRLEVSSVRHAWKVYAILIVIFWLGILIPNSVTGIRYVPLGQEHVAEWPSAVSGLALMFVRDNTLSMSMGLFPIVGPLLAVGNVFLTGQKGQYFIATGTMTLSDLAVRFAAFGWLEFIAVALLVTASWILSGKFLMMKLEKDMRLSIVFNRHVERRDLLVFVLTVSLGLGIMILSAAIEALLLFNGWIV